MLFQSVSSPDTISKLQNQIKQARQVIEQLETDRQLAIAEVKQQVHEEMQRKDEELAQIRSQGLALKEENTALKEKTEKLEKTGTPAQTFYSLYPKYSNSNMFVLKFECMVYLEYSLWVEDIFEIQFACKLLKLVSGSKPGYTPVSGKQSQCQFWLHSCICT